MVAYDRQCIKNIVCLNICSNAKKKLVARQAETHLEMYWPCRQERVDLADLKVPQPSYAF